MNLIKKSITLIVVTFFLAFQSCQDDAPNPIEPIEFDSDYYVLLVKENPSHGQILGTIQASLDKGDKGYTYLLKDQNPANALKIDAETGQITVADETLFDFEERKKIHATVIVYSSYGEQGEVGLEIGILDARDTPGTLPFIFTWDTKNDSYISIPHNKEVAGYDFTIDWGDGTIEKGKTEGAAHSYQKK